MDASRLNQGQMIAGVGGLVLIIAQFLSWISIDGASASSFDTFSAMDIIMVVIGLGAAAFAASVAANSTARVPRDAALILTAAGVLVVGWALGWDLENPDAGIGAWLALIAGAAIAYGGFTAGRTRRVGAPTVP
jgi:hypothetical protein